MATFIDASHNLRFSLNSPTKWKADLAKSAQGDVTGYQEVSTPAARTTVREFCAKNNRVLFHPVGCGNPISWKPGVFDKARVSGRWVQGMIEVHKSAIAMGINVDHNPEREIVYVGLVHKGTGKKILRVNVHPTSTGTMPESSPGNTDSDQLNIWKDWSIGQYWLDILSFIAGQMSLQDAGVRTMSNLWDIISLGGDYNAPLNRKDRWYYPGAMLPALMEPDTITTGLDHLQVTHGSDAKSKRRWSVKANTDHKIHFVERTIIAVPDFPRQLK